MSLWDAWAARPVGTARAASQTFLDGRVVLHVGDSLDILDGLEPNSIDSVVTDPPYFLTSIYKRFGGDDAKPAQFGKDGAFARLSGGFMNAKWDAPAEVTMDPGFGHWFAGFVDGEACFSVHKKQVNGCETYDCQFSLTLRDDDRPILEQVQKALGGIGSLAARPAKGTANPQARYCISSKADCQKLRALFTVFPLRAKKARDFEVWCAALDAWVSHEPRSSWADVAYYRDMLMAVKQYGSFYSPEQLFFYRIARKINRVLKPGGFVAAFGGTRTYHRLVCGFEDAGFEIRDSAMWIFGSGFPKSLDIGKGFEKTGNDAMAEKYKGYGTALKPAHEPIMIARKPLSEGTVVANVLAHGTGGLNIDGCRVEGEKPLRENSDGGEGVFGLGSRTVAGTSNEGRFPANLCHDGSPEVLAGFPDAGGGDKRGRGEGSRPGGFGDVGTASGDGEPCGQLYNDSGSAARFFYSPKANAKDRVRRKTEVVRIEWQSQDEPQLLVLETPLGQLLARATDASRSTAEGRAWCTILSGSTITDQFPTGTRFTTETTISSTTTSRTWNLLTTLPTSESMGDASCETESGGSPAGNAERLIGRVTTTNIPKIVAGVSVLGVDDVASQTPCTISVYERLEQGHPTCKPVALIRWLARLVTPPGGTLLDPFAGSGTTGQAAYEEGFNAVLCERETEYAADIAERMRRLSEP